MEQNKLTAQIVMAYPNCKVTDKYAEGKAYKVVGVSDYEGNLQVETSGGDTDWWNIEQMQMVLNPVTGIVDKDATELSEIISNGNYEPEYCVRLDHSDFPAVFKVGKDLFMCIAESGKILFQNDYGEDMPINISAWAIDYLRSRSYDLGYGSIPSLLTASIAIQIK